MYQVLYRKYRPRKIEDVVGQKNVVKTLSNAIKNDKISHSYIFYGPRGTGKTTLAKIMARSVNCLHLNDNILCDECENCKISSDPECVDIIEIDAASNNGVDEIRELKSKVNLVPSSLKYKIYIIDEVHMLSMGAFNALLKTIEEPPTHSIFILATTEIDKVPETIISRCQTFAFERVSNDDIVKRLRYVADEENIDISDDVFFEIARSSEGGMRDSLGMLDKLSIYKLGKITLEDFYELNSLLTKEELDDFIDNLCLGNIDNIVIKINKFISSGKNIIQIVNQLIYRMTDIIVDYYLLKKEKFNINIERLEYLANFLNEKMFDLKRSEHPSIYFEVLILNVLSNNIVEKPKILNDAKNDIVDKKINNGSVENLKTNAKNSSVSINKPLSVNYDYLYKVNKIRINNTFVEASKKDLLNHKSLFDKFGDYTFDTKIGYLVCDIMDGTVRAASKKNIIISYDYDTNVKHNLENIDKIQDVYEKVTGLNVKIALVTNENWEKIKEEYIKNKKDGIIYEYKEEPSVENDSSSSNNEIPNDSNSVIEMFGDIVEYE